MPIATLTDLLKYAHCDYLAVDLGRRLTCFSAAECEQWCQQQQPYPQPLQQQANFALVFWPQLDNAPQPLLWLLQLPLDERGLLELDAQQQFVQQVLALLQGRTNLTAEQLQQLQHSRYLLQPSEVQLAALNAYLRQRFQQPVSVHFAAAAQLLLTPQADASHIGLQGIHDLAQRFSTEPRYAHAWCQHFNAFPAAFQRALAVALEHAQISPEQLLATLTMLPSQSAPEQLLLLRSIASQAAHPALREWLLQQPLSSDLAILVVMRLWSVLEVCSSEQRGQLLERLQSACDPELWHSLLLNLLRTPSSRALVLPVLQRVDAPAALRASWQQLSRALR